MAQGRRALQFIALMARRGWSDERIQAMYDHALKCGFIHSSKVDTWLLSEKWVMDQGFYPRELERDNEAH